MSTKTKMITCFSAPRCLSTSLMYSFNSRADVSYVIDEPLYAHYVGATDAARPYREQLLREQDQNAQQVMQSMREGTYCKNRERKDDIDTSCNHGTELKPHAACTQEGGDEKFVYVKHIAKLLTTGEDVLREAVELAGKRSFILIRDPRKVLKSWTKVLPASLEERCVSL